MTSEIPFFDYEQCYNYYVKRIDSIRQKRIQNETIVAKPVLILALIDGIEDDVFPSNRFSINNWLEERYMKLMIQYTKNSQFSEVAGIEKPFWHLETDGFWHLKYPGEQLGKGRTPSKAWLKEIVEFAYFDESFWILLQNKIWRTKLRDYIIGHKLSDSSRSNTIKASGLGMLAAFLLSA